MSEVTTPCGPPVLGPLTDLAETAGVLRLSRGVDIHVAEMVAAVRRMAPGRVDLSGPQVFNEACCDVKRFGDGRGDMGPRPLDALHEGLIDVVSRLPVAVGDLTDREVVTEVRRHTTSRLGPTCQAGGSRR